MLRIAEHANDAAVFYLGQQATAVGAVVRAGEPANVSELPRHMKHHREPPDSNETTGFTEATESPVTLRVLRFLCGEISCGTRIVHVAQLAEQPGRGVWSAAVACVKIEMLGSTWIRSLGATGMPISREENRRCFEEIIRRPDAAIDLAEACLVIARHDHPSLDIHAYLRRLDGMAAELRDRLGAERHPLTVAAALARYLFRELGFSGAVEEYFDVRASHLNDVLDRKRGIPISLSVLYMEVARRAGFTVDGVGLPGHFIVKHPQPGGDLLVDPFNGGAFLSPDECAAKLREIYGGAVLYQPGMLGAVTKRQILSRTIHNLKTIYAAGRERAKALEMVELLLILAPWDLEEMRDRGMLRFQVGDCVGAIQDLETYLEYSVEACDLDRVRSNVRAIRRVIGKGSGIGWI